MYLYELSKYLNDYMCICMGNICDRNNSLVIMKSLHLL